MSAFVLSVSVLSFCPRCARLKSLSRLRMFRLNSLVIHGLLFCRKRSIFFGMELVAAVDRTVVNFCVAKSMSPSSTSSQSVVNSVFVRLSASRLVKSHISLC